MKIKTKKPVPYSWEGKRKDKTVKSFDLAKLTLYKPKGQTLQEVKDEVKDMPVAPQVVLDYLVENPNQVPDEFKDYWCHFFGSEVRGRDGFWYVPYGRWSGGKWYRSARWLRFDWDSDDRVVLLDDSKTLGNTSAEIDPLDIAARLERIEATLKHHNLSVG